MTVKKTATLLSVILLMLAFCVFAFAQTEVIGEEYIEAPNQTQCSLHGDVTEDGRITAADARAVLRATVGLEPLYGTALKSADTNNNGTCDAADARKILRIAVGLDNELFHVSGETIIFTPATCTQEGYCAELCLFCNALFDYGKLPFAEHPALQTITTQEPTCTQEGTEISKCLICQEILEFHILPPIDHVYGEKQYETPPSCTEAVNILWSCTLCGKIVEETEFPTGQHRYKTEILTEATCLQDGLQVEICSHCGEQKEPTVIKCPGTHRESAEWSTVERATCVKTGIRVRTCIRCKEVCTTEVIPAKGHTILEETHKIITEATCTDAGEETFYCKACGIDITQPIAPKGHTPMGETVRNEATCTQNGSITDICSVCNESFSIVIPAQGHSEELDWESDASNRLKYGYCKKCKELVKTEPLFTE